MKKLRTGIFMLFGVMIIYTNSCRKGNDDTRVSQNGGHSHNAGRNCMQCHQPNGSGSGWFNAAGTVYDSSGAIYPNTTVYLFTQRGGGGMAIDTLYGDNSGNFYTTDTINLGTGLFPAVAGRNGINYMIAPITTGACNGCHGVSTAKIWTY